MRQDADGVLHPRHHRAAGRGQTRNPEFVFKGISPKIFNLELKKHEIKQGYRGSYIYFTVLIYLENNSVPRRLFFTALQ